MRRGWLLFLLVLLAPEAVSQHVETWSPGYVVTTAGDTLRGELADLPELVASKQVVLRGHIDGEPQVLRAGQVDQVVFDSGRRYVGRFFSPADELPPEDLLLLRLVEGEVSLYAFSFEDPISLIDHIRATTEGRLLYRADRFAVETADGEMVALYERRIQPGFRATDIRVERQFEDQLRRVFADCPAETNRLSSLRFRQRDLVNAVARYNQCIGGGATMVEVLDRETTRRRSDVAVDFGVRLSAGMGAFHRLELRSHQRSDGEVLSAGLLVRVRPILIHHNFSIPIEVRFAHSGMPAHETVEPLEIDDFATLRGGLTLGFEQAFPVGGVDPFVGVGLTTSRIFQKSGVQECNVWVSTCWFAPKWEASYYLDVGIAGRPLDPLGRLALGVRFESIGIGQQSPFSRKGAAWQARTISVVTTVEF